MTIEEIRNGIAADPAIKTALLSDFDAELPEYLKGKGFTVRTTEEDKTEFEKEFGKRLGPKVSELYGGVEKDVLDTFGAFGVAKEGNTEKVYDLIKKAGTKITEKIAALETDLENAKKGKVDDVTKAELAALKTQIETLKGEKQSLTDGFTKKELGFKVGKDFDSAFSKLKINVPATVAEKDKADYIKSQIDLLSSAVANKYTAAEDNGRIVYKDSEGTVQMNGTDFATAADLLAKDHKYSFEVVAKKGGSGGSGSDEDSKPVVLTDRAQLYNQLQKEGLVMGSKAFLERGEVLAKANNLAWDYKKPEDKK